MPKRGEKKGTVGRPTLYRPEYVAQLLDAADEGLSLLAFAGIIGVGRTTLNHWKEEQPGFAAAWDIHQAKRTLKLERDLMKADSGPQVTSRIFALKNAAPDEWKDKHDVGFDGNLSVQIVRFGE